MDLRLNSLILKKEDTKMRYFEAECLDGNNLVGYGRFNPDHITAVEQFKTMEKNGTLTGNV